MSRKRYISTEISTDDKIAELSEHGLLPLLLFSWAIPHMDDWGRITGEVRQFKLLVCPALNVTSKEVDEAITSICAVGLWVRYDIDGKQYISAHEENWFKHQSYINKSKRENDAGSNFPKPPKNAEEYRKTPKVAEDQQETPNIAASFSFSSSFSSSSSFSKESGCGSNSQKNVFGMYQSEIGNLSETIKEELINLELEYTEEWVFRAIREAVMQDVKKMSYIKGTLKKWKIHNLDEPWLVERPTSNVTPFPRGGQAKQNTMDKLQELYDKAEEEERRAKNGGN